MTKFWFDILTPKQLKFFKPMIERLSQKGHSIECSMREYWELNELSRLMGFTGHLVGKHGGSNLDDKLSASLDRSAELARIVKNYNPEVMVSFVSPEATRVAFGLNMYTINFTDSPHAIAVSKLCLPLSDKVICPWIITPKMLTPFGVDQKKITHYQSLDPMVWLSERHFIRTINPNTIVFRMPESQAAYAANNSDDLALALIEDIIDGYLPDYSMRILPRYPAQREALLTKIYSSRHADMISIPDTAWDTMETLADAAVFIGAGGTMNCEAALLGIPSIAYQHWDIAINRYLTKRKLLTILPILDPGDIGVTARHIGNALEKNGKTSFNHMLPNPLDHIVTLLENSALEKA